MAAAGTAPIAGKRRSNNHATAAARNSAAAYTTNGARSEIAISPPPNNGPLTLPSRKLLDHRLVDRPRSRGGGSRINSAAAETGNMVDPIPPRDRSTSSCQETAAKAQAPVDQPATGVATT